MDQVQLDQLKKILANIEEDAAQLKKVITAASMSSTSPVKQGSSPASSFGGVSSRPIPPSMPQMPPKQPAATNIMPPSPIGNATTQPQAQNQTVYQEPAGIEGIFDGTNLVTPQGEHIEVPSSYSAKTRILFGDTVKMFEENGEKKFKVTVKQPKKRLKALTTKREGKWYALSGIGSYKIADSAAEFNGLEVNQEIIILVPENNTSVPFAAFDEIVGAQSQQPMAPPHQTQQVPQQTQSNSAQTPMQQPRPQMSQQQPQQTQQARPSSPASPQSQPAPQQPRPVPPVQQPRPAVQQPTTQQAQQQPGQPPLNTAKSDPASLRVLEDFDLV